MFSKADFLNYRGILCHHHVSRKKWDCAPWLAQIFSENFEYEPSPAKT